MAFCRGLRAPWPQPLPNGQARKRRPCQSSSSPRRARRESRRLTRRRPDGSTRRASPRRPSPTRQRRAGLCEDRCFRVVLLALVLQIYCSSIIVPPSKRRQTENWKTEKWHLLFFCHFSVFHFSVSYFSVCHFHVRRLIAISKSAHRERYCLSAR